MDMTVNITYCNDSSNCFCITYFLNFTFHDIRLFLLSLSVGFFIIKTIIPQIHFNAIFHMFISNHLKAKTPPIKILIGSVFSFFICNSYNISQTISALFSFVPFAPWNHNNSHSNKSTFHDWSKRNDIYLDPECSHIDFPYSYLLVFVLIPGYSNWCTDVWTSSFRIDLF